ncbi:DUF4249 domain-containing protein [Flavitalea sp. BT771]|uniref:DUF4249 domain-containing protein n=1 Tax=Flavitalea sp. BT771 TaxID=3063329 RepID=UPI0026E1684A|nr:DUF4249 domain-containing protein [Flavitalea sp. BT771]MDO6430745.1 DUF4249 domain-containing protein [Flavitalea sp. BT771]MDV6219115.1 DUF4249 domain-containing protein [Flavitalea sp. BT771]
MTKSLRITAPLLVLVTLLSYCKDKYNGPYIAPTTGYLVVEGYISGNGPTRFTLSRTIPLSSNGGLTLEGKAQLQVEGDDNSTYPLMEQGSGVYTAAALPVNPAAKYRLRIHTAGNKDYLSDYVAYKPTPPIDSITWALHRDGVDIYVNAHDPSNATRYYQWQFDETWQYTSAEYSAGVYREPPPQVVNRPDSEQIYNCWRNGASTALLLGSSAKLEQDVISLHLINHIPTDADQLSVKYSILVRQYALTEDGYNYLTRMQRNSESLGSIFDAQPSELKGNIHALSDPTEQVIGFVSAGTVQQQRIFIDRTQVPSWHHYFSCQEKDTVVPLDPAILKAFFSSGAGYVPVSMHTGPAGPDGWNGNFASCVDCRAQGGTTTRPSFWPY